jgi:hypothetical protein
MGTQTKGLGSQGFTNQLLDSVKTVDVTLSLDTNAYANGDVLADMQEVTGVMDFDGQGRVLQSVQVIDEDDNGIAIDVVVGTATFSLGTENAAVSVTDANARNIAAIVSVAAADYVDLVNSQQAFVDNIGHPVRAASGQTSLWVGAIARDAGTFTASGIRLRLGFS